MASFDQRNGQWRAQIRKTGFKPQTRSFSTKAQAQAWARTVEGNMDKGIAPDVGALRAQSVRQIFERFRDEVVPDRKGGRWEAVRIESFLRDAEFVHCRLDQDVTAVLRAWVTKRSKEVTGASVNRELNLISGVFSHAIKVWGVPLAANPVHQIKRPAGTKHRTRTWSVADLKTLRQYVESLGCNLARGRVVDYVLPTLELACETAMRLGEICSVLVEDVHLDDAWLRLRETKNGDTRDVPLSQRAVDILRDLVRAAEEADQARVVPIQKDSLGVEFREVRNKCGLDDLRFHDSRHTGATNLSKKLSNVLELSAVTGHRSLQSLKVYYNPVASELAKRLG